MPAVIIYPGMLCISVNSNISEMSGTDSLERKQFDHFQ